eukprot:237543_1
MPIGSRNSVKIMASIIDKITHLIEMIDDLYGKSNAGKAQITSYLFIKIIEDYFQNINNKCEYVNPYHISNTFLSHLIIVGGFGRDILMDSPINDIDLMLDTQQLNIFHLNHLQKYHSKHKNKTDSKCSLFQLYMNKFDRDDENKNDSIIKNEINTFECNYIINASFFINNILLKSTYLKNKCKIEFRTGFSGTRQQSQYGGYMMQICDDIYYKNVNLKGQEFDIFDPRHNIEQLQYLKTINKTNNNYNEFKDNVINLPIHKTKATDLFGTFDFSINAVIIRFSDIKICNGNWKDIVKNIYVDECECDGISDIKNKLLRFTSKYTLMFHYGGKGRLLYRILKFGGKYKLKNGWKWDIKTIKMFIDGYDEWFNKDTVSMEVNYKLFVRYFITKWVIEKKENGKIIWNYKQRMELLELFQFNERMRHLLDKVDVFRNEFVSEINKLSNDRKSQLISALKQFGYTQYV